MPASSGRSGALSATLQTLRRARRLVGRIRGRIRYQAVILLYHNIAASDADPWDLCVSAQHFAEHLEVVRRHFRPVPLRRLVGPDAGRAVGWGTLRRPVAVTFDDGYASTLAAARPVLERYDVPATVFLVGGAIGQPHEFWWDELARIALLAGSLPPALRLQVGGTSYAWPAAAAGGEGRPLDPGAAGRHPSAIARWRAWEDPPGPRQTLYRDLWQRLQPLAEPERRRVTGELAGWAGMSRTPRPSHRLLTGDEIVALVRTGLVDAGSHTMTHARLATLSAPAQQTELLASKRRLADLLGRPVDLLAYPFGGRADFTAETADLARRAGYAAACTNVGGAVGGGSDPFQLPRLYVGDWDGEELHRRLNQVLRG